MAALAPIAYHGQQSGNPGGRGRLEMLPKNCLIRPSIKNEITRPGRPIQILWRLIAIFVRPVCPTHKIAFPENTNGKTPATNIPTHFAYQDCNPARFKLRRLIAKQLPKAGRRFSYFLHDLHTKLIGPI